MPLFQPATVPLGFVQQLGLGLAAIVLISGFAAVASLFFHGGSALLTETSAIGRITDIVMRAGMQAGLSVFASLLVAMIAVRSLARCWGRRPARLLAMLCGIAMVVPTTVAASGILGLWGFQGLFAQYWRSATAMLGIETNWPEIYGLGGVVLAHVFFNAPLMIRVFLPALLTIPANYHKLADQFGCTAWQRFRLLEWPAIRMAVPALCLLVFLLCFTSFALVLMLGGGPAVTTLEVEIYAAIRFDFDLQSAALLSLVQIFIAGLMIMVMARIGGAAMPLPLADTMPAFEAATAATKGRFISWSGVSDLLVLGMLFLLIAMPLFVILLRGFNPALAEVIGWPVFHDALQRSVVIALISSLATLAAGFLLAESRVRLVGRNHSALLLLDAGMLVYMVIPAVVLGTAAFILLRGIANPFTLPWLLVPVANILMALPFVVRLLEARLYAVYHRHDRLAASLGISGGARLRILTLPAMRAQFGIAGGLAAALSIGDLGIIALFASQDFQTLPWLLYQTAGRYQAEAASSLASLLMLLTAGCFVFYFYASYLLPGVQRYRGGFHHA